MIPVANPKANYNAHRVEINQAIGRVLNSGTYIGGSEVTRFEEEFADYIGRKHAIGVGNGTDALIIALLALRPRTVTVRSDTAIATIAAIVDTGITPILIDDSQQAADMPVHLYGKATDVSAATIEDCAQSCGGYYNGKRLGTFGILGCFSFYPTKNLGALGDGGAIVTSDDDLAETCREIREYGWNSERTPIRIGFNSRLDPIQAAVLRVKLKYLDEDNERRRQIAFRYSRALADVVTIPNHQNHCFHLYVIRCTERDSLKEYLADCEIQTGIHYATPTHMEMAYRGKVRVGDCDLSKIEKRSKLILSLPMYPELSDREVNKVIAAVRSFYKA